jgi:hypothetical protein
MHLHLHLKFGHIELVRAGTPVPHTAPLAPTPRSAS